MSGGERTETQPAESRAVQPDAAPALLDGAHIDARYRVIRFIARGGMGEVYEVEDETLAVRVALKVMRRELVRDAAVVRRFRREVELARQITHEHVCRIFDTGTHADLPYLTMELLPGETLAMRIARGALASAEADAIARDLIDGLAAAHRAQVIHRDFKSSNVILVPRERVVITDFGLAHRDASAADASQLTGGAIVGSPGYMAPEQVLGGPTTTATDVYALGVVLYEMATGVLPFRGETPMATAALRLKVDPAPPRTLVPALPERWQAAILSCLRRDPSERPTLSGVRVILDGARAPGGRRKAVIFAAVVAVAAGGIAGGLALRGRGGGDDAAAAPTGVRLIPIATGNQERLVTAVSPDGRYVALADGELRVAGRDGGPIATLALPAGSRAYEATWFRDSTQLLVGLSRGGHREIGVLRRDGGDYELILDGASGGAVAPDGVHFAYASDAIYVARLDGAQPQRLADVRHAMWVSCAWSPDGRVLAVVDGLGLRLITLDGTVEDVAGAHPVEDAGVAWTGRDRVTYAVRGFDGVLVSQPVDIATARAHDEPTRLLQLPGQQITGIASEGGSLTLGVRTNRTMVEVGRIDRDGNVVDPVRHTNGVQTELPIGFTAAGDLVFLRRLPAERISVLIASDGGTPRQLVADPVTNASLADGGTTLVITRGNAVEELAIATGELRARADLPDDPGHAVAAEIKCTDRACVLVRRSASELVVAAYDRERGAGRTLATAPVSQSTGAPLVAPSPDGATIALAGYDIGLVLVDAATGARRELPLPCLSQAVTWLDVHRPVVSCMVNDPAHYELRLVEPDGTSRAIYSHPVSWMTAPAVDATGARIAFGAMKIEHAAYRVELDTP